MFTKISIVCAMALAALSCGCISGEVSDSAICFSQEDVKFNAKNENEDVSSFTVDISDQLKSLADVGASADDSSLTLISLTMSAKNGISDFTFMDTIDATASIPDDDSVQPIKIMSYTSPGGSIASPLDLPVDSQLNLYTLFSKGAVQVDLDVKGAIPSVDWSIDASVCFALDAKITKSL